MGKTFLIFALFSVVIGCQPAQKIVVNPSDSAGREGLHVTGTATVRAKPTLVVLRLGCNYSEAKATAAKSQAEATGRKILEAVKAAGVPEKDVQTSRFSLGSNFDPRTNVTSWRCSNMLEIRVTDIAKADTVLQVATDAGANAVEGIDYTIEELQTLRAQARDGACKVAKAKAQQFAKNLDVRLGKPTRISEAAPHGWAYNRNVASQSVMNTDVSPSSGPETVLSSGSVAVDLTVEVTYSIE